MYFDERAMFRWIRMLPEPERHTIFTLAVAVFGINERVQLEICRNSGCCNHWWHQDLNDPGVAAKILRENQR